MLPEIQVIYAYRVIDISHLPTFSIEVKLITVLFREYGQCNFALAEHCERTCKEECV